MTGSNGVIANTCVAILLYAASMANQTISGTYILMPTLLILRKRDEKKLLNKWKAIKAIIGAIFITALSMFLSVMVSCLLLYIDYRGPYAEINDAFH